ncbi:MAG: 2-oxo acid dehydrogenase subunit E2 [Firmicutes bacterium]|nr:2-oxo acid dehydrogenase subunit E2 [Alicyclobacillaceae bacterium]MCL6498095.1 2-oxo acid dehydrogenase subunit E2 [Bacillota bacterium]
MPFEFKLPDVGEGTTEGEIVRWLVQEGDQVALDQPLVEVQTDKAVVELPAPRAGVILARFGREGDVVPVGATLVVIGEATLASTPDAGPTPPEPVPTVPASPASAPPSPAEGGVKAAPYTRRLAKEAGIALEAVTGTGPQGRITPEDVRRYQAQAQAAASDPEREPVVLSGVRRRIAERLAASIREIPQVTVVEEVDATELVALRQRLKPVAEAAGVRLTYLAWVGKMLAVVLPRYPDFNARWEKDGLYRYRRIHLGVAVDTPDGLVVPVVRDVQEKSIFAIAREIADKAERARRRALSQEEMSGSTITITAGGTLGGLFATPLINVPEVAIFGLYQIRRKPWIHQGEIVPREVGHISLTFDHRVADGMMAARCLTEVAELIADPTRLLAELR